MSSFALRGLLDAACLVHRVDNFWYQCEDLYYNVNGICYSRIQ